MADIRQVALDILISWDREQSYPNLLLKERLTPFSEVRDRSFCTTLVYGTIEKKITLDYFISKVSSVPLRKIHIVTKNILRMGLYQCLYMNVPASAACNTSVTLAKKNGQFKSAGFVNAVLRKLAGTALSLPTGDDKNALSVRYSVHESIIDLLDRQYGTSFVKEYFDALDTLDRDVSTIAVNTIKTDTPTLKQVLLKQGVESEEIEQDLLAIRFTGHPENLEPYQNGWFHFIGRPSYHTACALDVFPGATVTDLCSAPGGKVFALAYKMKNQGKISAYDVYPHKIEHMKKEAERLGITNIEFMTWDSGDFLPDLEATQDRVLCDVPCSGLGIISKKPDIRYKDVSALMLLHTQEKILKNGMRYLKSDGKLVYSTCTVNREENEKILQNLQISYTDKLFLPQTNQTEGFYVAEVVKSEND